LQEPWRIVLGISRNALLNCSHFCLSTGGGLFGSTANTAGSNLFGSGGFGNTGILYGIYLP